MYDSFAASCDQPIHLINIISISNLAMSLLKKMSLHLYICTQCCQAWHILLQFNNIVITRYAVGPAIDVVRRNYGVNHLHESGRSLDYSSDSSFSHCLVGRNFFAISDMRMFAFCRVDYGLSSTRGFTP